MSLANKPHVNTSHVDLLLKQIKEVFLDGLNERCDELELLVLSLGDGTGVQENYDELYPALRAAEAPMEFLCSALSVIILKTR